MHLSNCLRIEVVQKLQYVISAAAIEAAIKFQSGSVFFSLNCFISCSNTRFQLIHHVQCRFTSMSIDRLIILKAEKASNVSQSVCIHN